MNIHCIAVHCCSAVPRLCSTADCLTRGCILVVVGRRITQKWPSGPHPRPPTPTSPPSLSTASDGVIPGPGHLGSGDECSLLCASCSVPSMIRTLGREGTCMSVQVIHAAQYSASRSPCRLSRRKPTPPTNKHRDTLLLRAIGAALMVIGSQHHHLSDVSARDVGCRLKAEIQMAIIAAAGPHCRLDPLKTEVVKFP